MVFGPKIYDYSGVRARAKRRLPWMVFDYIDGAAGHGNAVDRNRAAFDRFELRPRVLKNVSTRELNVDVFGKTAGSPFGISPMGMCNLAHPKADLAYASFGARTNSPVGVSTVASTDMETMLKWSKGNAWFQLYFSGDGSGTFALAERAKTAGYETLVITLDVPEVGHRPRELRRGFKMPFTIGPSQFIDFALHPEWSLRSLFSGPPTMANFEMPGYEFDRTESRAAADWEFFKKLRDLWPGKLVAKGVVDVADAKALVSAGVDAIQISSHGGRQLESTPAPFQALQDIRGAVGPGVNLFYDSGIMSGEDVLKAYLAGANYVFIGRYMQFAAASEGQSGVDNTVSFLNQQISLAMALTGLTKLN